VRVETAFNRILSVPGAWVRGVSFTPDGVVVQVRRRSTRLTCPCGRRARAGYDSSVRRWRHLDLGASRLLLQAEIRRLWCSSCGRIRTEQVPWARPGARHTRDFEDVVAWLAQRADKTTVARLLRCAWRTVDAIVIRVVVDHIDERRLDGLYRIGIDEISYRRGRRFVTVVADHDTGDVVWVGKHAAQTTLAGFFHDLGPARTRRLKAVSMDMSPNFHRATQRAAPKARICFDPFHVIQKANLALDRVYADAASELGLHGPEWQRKRFVLRRAAEDLEPRHREFLAGLRRVRHRLWRAWELKEELRDFYRIAPDRAAGYFKAWIARALRSRIQPFIRLARRLRDYQDGIIAAVELGLSNSRLEGINARIRLIHRRGYGYHSAAALIAMIHLTCGGLTITLPTQT
jgi:transposase